MQILNVRFHNMGFNEGIKAGIELVDRQNKANIFFLNLDCLYKSQKDSEYRDILNAASLVLPDGIGLKFVSKVLLGKVSHNCNGSDFSPLFMEALTKNKYRIFFLGGKKGIAERAANSIQKKITGVKIVGTHHGYFGNNNGRKVIDIINRSNADILFVGMGVPMQEKWIARNRATLNPKLCLGVGALFDYLSKRIIRAPKLMRILNVEWLWRIFFEPKRLFSRYLTDDIKFLCFVIKQGLKK